MIKNQKELDELIKKARATDAVALDTEFVWEKTYYPRLGLIQIALSDEDCYLIDPTCIQDLSALGDLLSDRRVVKIFHDAPQDLIILSQATKSIPKNIFDTRLAAGFAGLPATLSLSNLIKKLLEIDLPKTETRTNWLQRPLDKKQISYALDDVRYLRAARILLLNSIIGPEIKSWLKEELQLLNTPKNYFGPDDFHRYQKIRGSDQLGEQGLAILRELANWRENKARKANRPRGHIITDKSLLCIAKNPADNLESLQSNCSISPKLINRFGEELLLCTSKGIESDQTLDYQPSRQIRLNKKEKISYEKLTALIQLKSDVQGIDPALIGNSAELKLLVKIFNNSAPSWHNRQIEGWRKLFLKEFFRQSS